MASFLMHLAIAKLYLQKHPEENEEEFIKGSLAPDLTDDKSVSHYGSSSAWANPAKYLLENNKSIENSYKRGYFLHLATDYIFYHYLIDIEEDLKFTKGLKLEEILKLPKFIEWKNNQYNDFDILGQEVIDRYKIKNIPEEIKKYVVSKTGELKMFEREPLFRFLEDIASINIDKMADILLKKPDSDLVNLFKSLL